jgi:hypothetical protein
MITAGFLLCLVLCVAFGVAIPWALRADAAEAHTLHQPGTCNECDES